MNWYLVARLIGKNKRISGGVGKRVGPVWVGVNLFRLFLK